MTPFPSIASPRRHDRGGVSWVTALLLVVVAGAAYLSVAWFPVWVTSYAVKQTVRDFMNQAIKNRDDAALVQNLCQKLRSLEKRTVVGENGTEERVPVVDVQPGDVTWERDTSSSPPTLHVAFEYTQLVEYPYLPSMDREWVGTIDLEQELAVVDWGPAR